MKTMRFVISMLVVSLGLTAVPAFSKDKVADSKAAAKTADTAKKAPAAAVSDADIAAAKAAGKVWVNTGSDNKVFHRADSHWYGKTKQGQFMTEADAIKAGYRATKNEDSSGKAMAPTKAPAAKK